jgi:hypothetical protein
VLSAKSDPLGFFGPLLRAPIALLIRSLLPDFFAYDGIERLIDGLYIGWNVMTVAGLHTIVWGGVLLVLPGWLIFRSREVAQAVT